MTFIVFEGIDGAGTTTQAAELDRRLRAQNIPTYLTREPSGGPVGCYIRELLQMHKNTLSPSRMALLFAADRLDHVEREVLPALNDDKVVISDRYVLSSLAYQSIDNPEDWVVSINTRTLEADMTILLDVPVDVAAERRRKRGGSIEAYDDDEFQKRVRQNYLRFLRSIPHSLWLDAACPMQRLADQIELLTAPVTTSSVPVDEIRKRVI